MFCKESVRYFGVETKRFIRGDSIVLIYMFVLEQEEFSFIEVPITVNISRFIKTISGIPTSDVYTVIRNLDNLGVII